MDKLVELTPYIPIIIAILAATLGYIYGQRGSKITRFMTQVDYNLKEVCGPMYFSISNTLRIEDPEIREGFLDSFFEKFSTEKFDIYKLGNINVIKHYINLEINYYKFKDTRSSVVWKELWEELVTLKEMLEREYWRNYNSLYSEYRWFQKNLYSNIFMRIWNEVVHLVLQTAQFCLSIAALFLYLSLVDYLFIKNFPEGTLSTACIILIFTILFYIFTIFIGVTLSDLKQQNESILRKICKRFAPNLIKKWDRLFIRKRKLEIPTMFTKQ